jgi:hypothetical protein
LVLVLFVFLLSIGLLAMCQKLDFEIRRDREEELIHRGVEYSRAVRRFVKTFGYYPNSVEALESTNNIRFLRKRYKDPITGKDFKFLHMNDLQAYSGPAAPAIPKVIPKASEVKLRKPPPGSEPSSDPPAAAVAADAPSNDESSDQPAADDSASESAGALPPDPSEAPATDDSETPPGGPIVGVASISSGKTIREFNKKDHYDQWQFVYDPSTDHVGLVVGPNQPLPRRTEQASSMPNEPQTIESSKNSLNRANRSARPQR